MTRRQSPLPSPDRECKAGPELPRGSKERDATSEQRSRPGERPERQSAPRALLLIGEPQVRERIRRGLRRMGLGVDAPEEKVPSGASISKAPDVLIMQRTFAGGTGAVAICLARPCGPADASRLLAELARGEERALAARLGVSPHVIAGRLVDLLPGLATAVALDHQPGALASETTRLRMTEVLQELEDCLMVLMLGNARSDRETARWLGLSEGTLRSKMRKRHIRSARSRRPSQ